MVGLQTVHICCVSASFTDGFLHATWLSFTARLTTKTHPQWSSEMWLWNQNLLILHAVITIAVVYYPSNSNLS